MTIHLEADMKAFLAIVAALMLANTAVAGDEYTKDKDQARAMKDADVKFKKLDSDNDAQLSKSEASKDGALSASFASIDQNADGFVSKAEFTARLDSKSSSWDEKPR
jgi:Ca2+-binding EF-hand superfamily protein